MIMADNSKKPEVSAGVVVMRHDPVRGPLVLTLSVYGNLDLPKGHVEEEHLGLADPLLQTAIDELEQESNFILKPIGSELMITEPIAALISNEKYECNNIDKKTGRIKKHVFLYAADTLYTGPITIVENPKSGIKEHDAAVWLPFDRVAESRIHKYMIPGVLWAMGVYENMLLKR
jgi:8-oxo-dGTP pyrophosphatase MutT (NUDIX family)